MAVLGKISQESALDQDQSVSTRSLDRVEEMHVDAPGRAQFILTASLERLSDAIDMRKFLEYVFEEILRVTGATNASTTRYDKHTNHLQLELFVDASGPRWGMSANEIALWASPYDADTTPSFGIGRQSRRVFVASLLKDRTEIDIEDFALPGGLEYITANGVSDAAFSVLTVGEEPVGTFHLHFTDGRILQPKDLPLLQGLSQQAAIALRFVALSEEVQRGAIAHKRELSAERHRAELVRANEALSESIRSLKDIEDIDGFLHSVLIAAERVSASVGAAAFIYGRDGRLYMRAYVEGGEPFSIATDTRMEVWRDEVEWTDGFNHIWRDICGSRGYWISPSNDPKISQKYHEWHRQRGHAITLCLPLAQGDRFLGFLGLAFATHVELDQNRLELTRSLAQQTTLAVEANRLAQQAQEAAVTRERELEAQVRAQEANRISSFMAATLGQMSEEVDLRLTIETIVAGLGKELGATHVFLLRHDPATRLIHLELSLIEGQVRRGLSGEEMALFAAPFPDDITPAWQIMAERRRLFTPDMTPIPASEFAWPGAFEYIARFSLSDVGHIVLFAGDEPVGSIGFGLNDGRKLKPSDKPFIEGVAKQAALAIRMMDLAEQAKQRAVEETNRRAAQARAEELEQANDNLAHAVGLLHAVGQFAEMVLASRDFSRLGKALGVLGEAVAADRVYTFAIQDLSGVAILDHSWLGLHIPAIPNGLCIQESDMPEVFATLRRGQAYQGHPNSREGTNAELNEEAQTLSDLILPIILEGELCGAIGFDDCHNVRSWSEEEIRVLKSAAATIAAATERQQAEKEVQEAVAQEREKAAQERTAELAKANDALRRSVSRLVQAADVDAALVEAVRTAAEVTDAHGGALGLFVTEEQGFRNMFILVEGKVSKVDALAFDSRLYSLNEEPLRLAWNEFQNGNDVLWCDLESKFLTEDSKQFLRDRDLRSSVLVALKRGSECVGYLGLSGRSETDLAPGHRELLRAIADQLCLMLELSRLARASEDAAVAQVREAAAQERAAELAKANNALQKTTDALAATQEIEQIIPAVLQIIASTFGSKAAGYYEFGPDDKIYLRFYLLGDQVLTATKLMAHPDLQLHNVPRILAESFSVNDDYLGAPVRKRVFTSIVDHYSGTSVPAFDAWARENGWELELNIPLVVGAESFAALCLYREAAKPFSSLEIELAEALVKQLSLAVQAYRLAADSEAKAIAIAIALERESAEKKRADELTAVNQTLTSSFQRIAKQSETFSAPAVFLADIAKAASAELCYWLDYDAQTEQVSLSLRCRDGLIIDRPEPGEPEVFSSPFPASLLAEWLQSPVDDQFTILSVERDNDRLWPETAEWHKRAGRKEVLCFAVALGDRPIGVLGMAFCHETSWTTAGKELIRTLASHLALSVHLCRLSEQATRWAATEERTRLAREIHDTLAQGFSGILVQLRAMQQSEESGNESARNSHFDNALELANAGLAEARRSLASLRLRELEGRSFREALTLMAQSAMKRAGIPISIQTGLDIELGLGNEAELLRIAQESVTNAIKHSGASQITIALRHGAETIDLCIEDNGKGFDPQTTTEGFGLLGMEERAARIGATMTIESSTSGTSVCVHLSRKGR